MIAYSQDHTMLPMADLGIIYYSLTWSKVPSISLGYLNRLGFYKDLPVYAVGTICFMCFSWSETSLLFDFKISIVWNYWQQWALLENI